jgi:hypothetical protein
METKNYLLALKDFISEGLKLASRMSESDREKTNSLKRQYLMITNSSSGSIKDRGFYDVVFSVTGVGVSLLRIFTKSPLDHQVIDGMANQLVPGMKNMMISRIDSMTRQTDAQQFIVGNEHQAKANASDTGKHDLIAAINAAYQAANPR